MSSSLNPSLLKYDPKALFDKMKWPVVTYGVVAAVYVALIPGKWIWFSWHPLMMMISFFILSSFAAMYKKIGGYENTKLHGY